MFENIFYLLFFSIIVNKLNDQQTNICHNFILFTKNIKIIVNNTDENRRTLTSHSHKDLNLNKFSLQRDHKKKSK